MSGDGGGGDRKTVSLPKKARGRVYPKRPEPEVIYLRRIGPGKLEINYPHKMFSGEPSVTLETDDERLHVNAGGQTYEYEQNFSNGK